MARFRQYDEAVDVLQAAVRRLEHIYNSFDSVVVCFSGGKDSLVVLHLARLVAARFGITRVPVIFRDEELIPDCVIDFVDSYRREPWVDMRWYAVPLRSSRLVLGETRSYVQWDTTREWVRPKPDWAITLPPGDDRVFSQYDMDEFSGREFPGKVCFLTGIRADESILRFRAIVNKLSQSWVCASSAPRVMLGRPIYDWSEGDIFKFFFDHEITPCPIYDMQLLGGQKLRVSTPLSSEPAKVLSTLRAIDPGFLDRILKVFPGTDIQERYWKDYDRQSVVAEYEGRGLDGVEAWVRDNLEPDMQEKALKHLSDVRVRSIRRPESYPIDYVLKCFLSGGWKRGVNPISATELKIHTKSAANKAAKKVKEKA